MSPPQVQLLLPLDPPTALHRVLADYLNRHAPDLAEGTVADYQERARWLLRELGENTPIETLNYAALERLADRCSGVIRNVTIKKRIEFLRWCIRYAHKRGLVPGVPECPKLRNDGQVKRDIHTVGQWETFRQHLPAGRFRKIYDLGFWTLQHMPDVFSMERWMIDADRVVTDERGNELARGAFWRRNQKYRRCIDCWIPMQPELRLIVPELLEDVGPARDALVVGRVWNLKRTLDMAADRAVAAGLDVTRITPTGLRRSGASMLTGRGWPLEAVRIALGHASSGGRIIGGDERARPTTAERHYMLPTPGLFPAPKDRNEHRS